jgi:tetratricopeptide (TPR) repeat protein
MTAARARLWWVAAGSLLAAASVARMGTAGDEGPPRVPTLTEPEIRELDIEFYRARAARDPHAASDRAQLARLHLQRARETGEYHDLRRAEEHARASLDIRRGRNGAAYAVLAASLMAQHRFLEAHDAAGRLLALDSTAAGARALVAEIELELGRYESARRHLGMLTLRRSDPVVGPRLARWEELRGRPEAARALLREARARLTRMHGVPGEQLAWLQLRLGDLALRHGRLAEAEAELEAGLARAPGDHRLLAAAARLALARGTPDRARVLGERAIGQSLDPATLGLLHDAAELQGDTAAAGQYARAMAAAVLTQPGPLHRAWSLFLLDRGQDVVTVLERARAELALRRDVYGWDLYAWALYRSGRTAEAAGAMPHALALGTRDAVMQYHAGMIARATGDEGAARHHLEAALAINPFWHWAQTHTARAVLDSLGERSADDE